MKPKYDGYAKLKIASKSNIEPVTPVLRSPPTSISESNLLPLKRKRGRPRKTLSPTEVAPKILRTFKRVLEDQELIVAEPVYDGGGTRVDAPAVTKESLERRVSRRLNVLDRYLTDERLLALLGASSLKEVGIYEGIMLDKALVLKGQPTVIIGSEDRAHIDQLLPRLLSELRNRKLITTVSERKVQFQDAG
jgi:hypothetical protein